MKRGGLRGRGRLRERDGAGFHRVGSSSDGDGIGDRNGSAAGPEGVDWELRPGGMLVQRRDRTTDPSPSSGPLLKLKISYGRVQHDVIIPSEATFGDLKWILAPLTSLRPQEQRLLFRGKERDDSDHLHLAGVVDKSKIILVEDPASKEKKWEEVKRNENISKACQTVSHIRQDVDKLEGEITNLEAMVGSGQKLSDRKFSFLSELLMRKLFELDSIEADGMAKAQRKIEVQRVQGFADRVDRLKAQNSNPLRSNAVVVTTQWETFDTGVGSLSAPQALASSTMTTKWELF